MSINGPGAIGPSCPKPANHCGGGLEVYAKNLLFDEDIKTLLDLEYALAEKCSSAETVHALIADLKEEVEAEVESAVRKSIQSDQSRINIFGQTYLFHEEDAVREINALLEKVGSLKRLTAPLPFIFGEISRHEKLNGIDVIVFKENELISPSENSLGATDNHWGITSIREKSCRAQIETKALKPPLNALLAPYGIKFPADLAPRKDQLTADLVECVKYHELQHHTYFQYMLKSFQNLFGIGSPVDVLLEARADLDVLKHIVDLGRTDKNKASRLAFLWALKASTENYLDRKIITLILFSCMQKDPKSGRLTIDFSKLEALVDRHSKIIDRALEGLLIKVKQLVFKMNAPLRPSQSKKDWDQELTLLMETFTAERNKDFSIQRAIFQASIDQGLSFLSDLINDPEITGSVARTNFSTDHEAITALDALIAQRLAYCL